MLKDAIPLPVETVLFVVAAALTDAHGRVLVQRRPAGAALAGLWEFPGGKVEPGETPEAALVRELAEELGIVAAADALEPVTFASMSLPERHLVLLLYRCLAWNGEPRALAADAIAWHTLRELDALAMPPADAPFAAALERMASSLG